MDIRATIVGNLVRDAEFSQTKGGTSVLKFTVASNRREKQEDGTWGDGDPTYRTCYLYGARADGLANLLYKGMKVTVVGREHDRNYETKDGEKRRATEVDVDELEFMSRKEQGNKPDPQKSVPKNDSQDVSDSDIPF